MKAAVLHAPGDLRVEETADPEPRAGRVIVRVRASGVCGSDMPRILETGTYYAPAILGHEFMGEVVSAGEGVEGIPTGTRAAVIPLIPCGKCASCRERAPFHCEKYDFLGSRSDGGFAELCSVPAENIVPVGDGVSDEAAAMMEPVSVACHCVRRVGVQAGDTVVVFGSGAIGNFIAQWARALGAESVAIVDVRSPALEVAAACGLATIDGSKEDVVARVNEMTDGRGADIAIEAAGSAVATTQAFDCVRRQGAVGLIGRIDGDFTLPGDTLTNILRRELRIQGVWGFDHWCEPQNDWAAAAEALDAGKIQVDPLITQRYSLDGFNEAVTMISSGDEYYCKVIIQP